MTLQEEKEKALFEHRLEMRRVLIEKVLLGVLIGIAALLANVLMERFKSDLSQERFLLEARMAAVKDLRESYSSLNNYVLRVKDETKPAEVTKLRKAHAAELEKFGNLINRSGWLFSSESADAVARHGYIHTAISRGKPIVDASQWQFLAEISDNFDAVTRVMLWEQSSKSGPTGFELEAWSFEEVNAKGSAAYFDANYEKWKKRKTAKPAGPEQAPVLIGLVVALLGIFALSLGGLLNRK
jgi:hypothetical protein